jgi:putative transposase
VIACVDACRGRFGVEPVCRVLTASGAPIAPSTYYASRSRPPSPRAARDARLLGEIIRVHKQSDGTYGAWKVWRQLNREGISCARCTVERLMRTAGLAGVRRGKPRRTTVVRAAAPRPPDLVGRDFQPPAPNRLWVVDLTYVPMAGGGFSYTALVIDAFARLIPGWKVAGHLRTSLALDALEMAISARLRASQDITGVIHHSDRGSQYLAIKYTSRLARAGAVTSVGSKGDSYDNALAETVIGLYKAELVRRHSPWNTTEDLEAATARWVAWFNHRRLLRRLGGIPPAEHESNWRRQQGRPS